MIRLISMPQIDVGGFGRLRLPLPDGINNGGYVVPTPVGAMSAYSPVDLLVAGLSGDRITNLVEFFDKYRVKYIPHMDEVFLTLEMDNEIVHKTIPMLKVSCEVDTDLLKVLRRNAPLTFKWI